MYMSMYICITYTHTCTCTCRPCLCKESYNNSVKWSAVFKLRLDCSKTLLTAKVLPVHVYVCMCTYIHVHFVHVLWYIQ